MTCRQIAERADELVGGRADPAELELAREHATECETCALVLDRAEALRDLLDLGRDEITAPPGLLEVVRERLEQQAARTAGWMRLRVLVANPALRLAACGAVIALVLFGALHGLPRRDVEVAPPSPLVIAADPATGDPRMLEALRTAAESNREPTLFADVNVVDLAQGQAGDLATACLDM
jgi:predicted anti-sigma-YlaC factor YlaD